jgi:hypothetical protein
MQDRELLGSKDTVVSRMLAGFEAEGLVTESTDLRCVHAASLAGTGGLKHSILQASKHFYLIHR